jgi:hypothetical protein
VVERNIGNRGRVRRKWKWVWMQFLELGRWNAKAASAPGYHKIQRYPFSAEGPRECCGKAPVFVYRDQNRRRVNLLVNHTYEIRCGGSRKDGPEVWKLENGFHNATDREGSDRTHLKTSAPLGFANILLPRRQITQKLTVTHINLDRIRLNFLWGCHPPISTRNRR